ncbi:MAG: hypothetical protein ACRDU8_07245, partial [Egibacteraceae bacterium]
MRCDLVLADAVVIDGTGAPAVRADVGVHDGRVAAIGEGLRGRRIVRLDGRVLAPGFVDAHTHTDVAVTDPRLSFAAVSQGITTQVVGHCGWSAFPCAPERAGAVSDFCR